MPPKGTKNAKSKSNSNNSGLNLNTSSNSNSELNAESITNENKVKSSIKEKEKEANAQANAQADAQADAQANAQANAESSDSNDTYSQSDLSAKTFEFGNRENYAFANRGNYSFSNNENKMVDYEEKLGKIVEEPTLTKKEKYQKKVISHIKNVELEEEEIKKKLELEEENKKKDVSGKQFEEIYVPTIQNKVTRQQKQNKYEERKDPLLKKLREGDNYSEELKEMNNDLRRLDSTVLEEIEKEEEKLLNWGETLKQPVIDKFSDKKDHFEVLYMGRTIKYPRDETDHEQRIKAFNDAEDKELEAIDRRVREAIIYMKKKFLRTYKITPIKPIAIEVKDIQTDLLYDKLYVKALLHEKIAVPFNRIGSNMSYYFKKYASKEIEGRCRKEGYIRPDSTNIISHSTGLLKSDMVIYDVVFSCETCFPYENMEVMCKIKNITKIGIRGVINEIHNPIVLFISREHNANKNFDDYEEGNMIKIRVIGHRFELNDEYISVIGEII